METLLCCEPVRGTCRLYKETTFKQESFYRYWFLRVATLGYPRCASTNQRYLSTPREISGRCRPCPCRRVRRSDRSHDARPCRRRPAQMSAPRNGPALPRERAGILSVPCASSPPG